MDNKININKYKLLLENVKQEVLNTQYKAIYAVNKELMFMYWHIGKIILENNQWGNKFIDNLFYFCEEHIKRERIILIYVLLKIHDR